MNRLYRDVWNADGQASHNNLYTFIMITHETFTVTETRPDFARADTKLTNMVGMLHVIKKLRERSERNGRTRAARDAYERD